MSEGYFKQRTSPEFYARELLHSLRIEIVPTPVIDICELLNISLRFSDKLQTEALFFRVNGQCHIWVKKNDSYETRENFSIAHELGHFYIPSHLDRYECSISDLNNYSPNKIFEKEANEFAAELLMPAKFFSLDVNKTSFSLGSIIDIAEKYNTSLISTAIRFTAFTRDIGALICSENGKIKWIFKSEAFRANVLEGKLNKYTEAYNYFTNGELLNGRAVKVPSYAWISSSKNNYILEETIAMPRLNQTLTTIQPKIDIEDIDDDEFDY